MFLFHLPRLPGKQGSNIKHLAPEVWWAPIPTPEGQLEAPSQITTLLQHLRNTFLEDSESQNDP